MRIMNVLIAKSLSTVLPGHSGHWVNACSLLSTSLLVSSTLSDCFLSDPSRCEQREMVLGIRIADLHSESLEVKLFRSASSHIPNQRIGIFTCIREEEIGLYLEKEVQQITFINLSTIDILG